MLLLEGELLSLADPTKAAILQRFFKTGPGEYGEGDKFLGIKIPDIRALVKLYFPEITLAGIEGFLQSEWHEIRMSWALALVMLFEKEMTLYKKTKDESVRLKAEKAMQEMFEFYLAHAASLNNWDLVDLSAPRVFWEYLRMLPDSEATKILDRLAVSWMLWERRIAIVWAFAFLKAGDSHHTIRLAKMLLHDKESLMHKAVGWMLREMGKRCSRETLLQFVEEYIDTMPRTMLRYSLEHLPKLQYKEYLERGK